MKQFMMLMFVCLFSQTAWAGWVVTYRTEAGSRSQEFYEGGKMSSGEAIYTDGHFIVVDRGSRSYWKGTPRQYCDALLSMKKKMEAQMASLPAQFRPKPISQKKVSRKKLGTKSIAGYMSTGYVFFVDGISGDDVWISSASSLSGIIDVERSMAKKMKCFESMDTSSIEGAAIYKRTVEGSFILKGSNRQVVSVEKKAISSGKFNVPGGYKSFSDFKRFTQYASHHSSASSRPPPRLMEPSYDMPTKHSSRNIQPEQRMKKQSNKEDNFIVKDARANSKSVTFR